MSEEILLWAEGVPNKFKENLKSAVTSPTMVWFTSLYLISSLSMIIFNMTRVGFVEGITGAHEYYTQLFLFYGLNRLSEYDNPYLEGFGAILIGPYLAIFMGITLFYLRDAGFAVNGNTRAMDPLLPDGDPSYAFFKETVVYGSSVRIFGMKGNLFYIGIVWLPIILASIATIIYKRRSEKSSSIVWRFIGNFVISLWLATQVAKMTDPEFYYDWQPTIPVWGFENAFWFIVTVSAFAIIAAIYYDRIIAGDRFPIKTSFVFLTVFLFSFLVRTSILGEDIRYWILVMLYLLASGTIAYYLKFTKEKDIPLVTTTLLIFFAINWMVPGVSGFFVNFMGWESFSVFVFPDIIESLVPGGLYESLFIDRRRNKFVIFSGQYHPLTTAMIFAIFQIVPMIVQLLLEGSISGVKSIKHQLEMQQLNKSYQESRMAEGVSELPWQEDSKIENKIEEEL